MFNDPRVNDTTKLKIDYSALGWEKQELRCISVGTILNHGNLSGVDGGAGQSGSSGNAIWLTSENDKNAAYGYSQGKALLQYRVISELRLALFDESNNQVFPDEIDSWKLAREQHALDGVLTEYRDGHGRVVSQEIFLFDRNKIILKRTVDFASITGSK